MSHATCTGNICNFKGWQVLLNANDRCVLPSIGPLCSIFPWHRLITFIREGHRRHNCKRLETSGPLSGDVPGEVDHQRVGLTRVSVVWLVAYISFPFLRTADLNLPPCSSFLVANPPLLDMSRHRAMSLDALNKNLLCHHQGQSYQPRAMLLI